MQTTGIAKGISNLKTVLQALTVSACNSIKFNTCLGGWSFRGSGLGLQSKDQKNT